ncbi:MAG: hypothetical protein IJY87_01255 [Bacilli bacterium]|nr:hypothetical protein [Bacilli bacterium]
MDVLINNCNNIKNGCICIEKNKLNIKYGVNGTGKSTISSAINKKIKNETLESLKPFNSDESIIPQIEGCDEFHSIKTYNDEYVSKFLFLPNADQLHQNSFEVFIKPGDYEEQIEKINCILGIVKDYVVSNEIINNVINQKNELNKLIKLNAKQNSINSTGVGKALSIGNKIINIPERVNNYKDNLNSNDKVKWYAWNNDGRQFIVNKHCPFCGQNLQDDFSEIMNALDELFDKKNVESLLKTQNIVDNLSKIIGEDTTKFMDSVLNNEEPIKEEEKEKISQFIVEIDKLCEKLNFYMQLDYSNLKNINNLEEILTNNRFNLTDYNLICGEDFKEMINSLNNKVDEMLLNIQNLKININKLNSSVKVYANNNKRRINDFLETVGMNYEVDVQNDKLLLFYKNSNIIVDASSHLSWGEKNAFALSLFLFDCLHENPDLIILDDPVSSFDFNKKYAITYYLFHQNNSLKGKTVLMLTHDLEPIINIIKIKKFPYAQSYYIENNKGIVFETLILDEDIESILNVTKENYTNPKLHIINRLVHLRRYLELNNEYEDEYNMLSSLLKGYKQPIYLLGGNKRGFTDIEYKDTENKLRKFISEFDYNDICCIINDKAKMKQLYLNCKNNYEKTEIFRIMLKTFGLLNINPVVEEFINEEFHIENAYIFQLDPYAYNLVPNYIVEMCDNIVNRIEEKVLITS